MQRLKVSKADDGDWDDRVDWNVNEVDGAQNLSDKEILTEGLDLKNTQTRWRTISAFAASTSVHGLYYVLGRGQHPARRIVWAILLVFTAIMFFANSIQFMGMYLHYPTKMSVHVARASEMNFPAVSICNLNSVRASVMNGSELDKVLRNKVSRWRARWTMNASAFDIVEEARHEMKDMLIRCRHRRTRCTEKDFETFTYRFYDICYTFNSGKHGKRLFTQVAPGRYYGLKLTLNIEHEKYYIGTPGAGFRVIVHQQGDVPVRKAGILVSPGTLNHFVLNLKKVNRLPVPYQSGCGSRKLKYFKTYTTDNCWTETLSAKVIKKCNCKLSFMKGTAKMCEGRTLMRCTFSVWSKFNKDQEFDKMCPLPCNFEKYDVTASSALFPSNSDTGRIASIFNVSGTHEEQRTYLRENFIKLNIFFEDFHHEIYYEEPSFRMYTLISLICAMIVFYFGASCLTIYEFFDLLITIIIRKIKKKRRTSNYPSRM